MATASVPVEADDQECPVCHALFTDPKLLPCGHLLCRHCLISWLQSKTQAHCPLCRCVIVDPEERTGGKSLEDIADGFPTDLAMAALVESQQLLSKNHVCRACETQNATSICLTCGDLLCANCVAIHKRMSSTEHHTAEELSSLTADKLAASRPSFCAVHADKTSEVYCPTHGSSICLLCATTDHRQCPEVTKLETKVEEARAVLAELAATLSAGETELERAISQMDQHLRDTEKRTRAAIAEIEAMCDRLESAVKECRRRMKELALGACSDVKKAVEEGKTCLFKRRGKLTSHKTVVKRARKSATCDAVTGMTSAMQTRVNDLDCNAALPVDAKVISTVTFVIDTEAVSRVERELSELGQVKVVPADVAANGKPAVFGFHDNHGKSIVLSDNQRTAERTGGKGSGCSGIVMSRDPMRVNHLYEVRIDQTDDSWSYQHVYLGVVTQSPDAITLPDWSGKMPSAVVVHHDWVRVNGVQTKTTVGAPLCDVREGGRVGLALDKSRTLYLYIDGIRVGVVTRDVADPCYVMIDLAVCWKKVTALPVTRVE